MNTISLLKRIGFSKTTFSETIITINCISEYYTTPIGFKIDKGELVARVYKNTKLFEFLIRSDCKYCLCITSNPLLFYRSVLDRSSLKYRFIEEIGAECIDKCDMYVKLDRIRVIDRGNYVFINFKPINVIVINKYPRVFRRVDYAFIEALIYYTKLPFVDREIRLNLLERIKWCREVIYRSSKYRLYRELINNIVMKAYGYLD